jgi:hypothetical protein
LAALIARRETNWPVDYRKGAREKMGTDLGFRDAFKRAKDQISEMEVRAVEEGDPVRQTLLEVYCAIAINAKYNDFCTH